MTFRGLSDHLLFKMLLDVKDEGLKRPAGNLHVRICGGHRVTGGSTQRCTCGEGLWACAIGRSKKPLLMVQMAGQAPGTQRYNVM